MNLLELLSEGERKEIAQSIEVAELLVQNESNIQDYFKLLSENHTNNTVISHGFFALKEASFKSEVIRQKSISFIFKSVTLFDQWEARENFLRILLFKPEKIFLKGKKLNTIKSFLDYHSSIVRAYTIEVLITASVNANYDVNRWIELGLSDEKAAVKARTRKMIKQFKLENLK